MCESMEQSREQPASCDLQTAFSHPRPYVLGDLAVVPQVMDMGSTETVSHVSNCPALFQRFLFGPKHEARLFGLEARTRPPSLPGC